MFGLPFWQASPFMAAGWIGTCLLISRLSGWTALAERYRAVGAAVTAKQRTFRSALMRWGARYGNCLFFAADETGLRLSILFILRPGHPPLFFPWSEVTVGQTRRFFQEFVELRLRRVPEVPLLITGEMASWLAGAAGPSWPGRTGASEASIPAVKREVF
jgi:hypothetical protein